MAGDLDDPDVRPLWEAVARRLAQGANPASIRHVRTGLNEAGVAMVEGWLSKQRPTRLKKVDGQVVVPLAKLLEALPMTPDQLRAYVRTRIGYEDLADDRRRRQDLRESLKDYAARCLPDTPRLRERLGTGSVDGTAPTDRRDLISALARARHLLPLTRPVPLPRLSQACAGDPHFFDLNESGNGSSLVQLAADLRQVPFPDHATAERTLLADVGVLADRLSQTVITRGINAVGDGPVDRLLRTALADLLPVNLNALHLTDSPPRFDPEQRWLVVENPSVMEEAILRGYTGPMVCTLGNLTSVDHFLLAAAAAQGVAVSYAGDYDAAGQAIAQAAARRHGADLSLMADEVRRAAAATRAPSPVVDGVPDLTGPSRSPGIPAAADDPADYVVFQEHPVVLDHLLGPDPHDPLSMSRLRGEAHGAGTAS